MPSRLRTIFAVIFLVAALITAPSGEASEVESLDRDRDTSKVVLKMQMQMHSRRRALTDVLDYDYGAANSKHDPHRKPGNGH